MEAVLKPFSPVFNIFHLNCDNLVFYPATPMFESPCMKVLLSVFDSNGHN